MKYLKYFLPGILFLFGFCLFSINVKADTVEFNNQNGYTSGLSLQEIFNYKESKEYIEELQRLLFEKYESEYSDLYPYYSISIDFYRDSDYDTSIVPDSSSNKVRKISFSMVMSNQEFNIKYNQSVNNGYGQTFLEDGTLLGGDPVSGKYQQLTTTYDVKTTTYDLPKLVSYVVSPGSYSFNSNNYYSSFLVSSNFDIIFYTNHDSIVIHNFRDTGNDYILKSGDVLSTLFKGKDFNNNTVNLVEVDLNSYPYIALSLKDYSKTEEFSVTNYVKGQYCLSPIYDYGLKERKDVLTGTKIQRCSLVYTDFTPVRTSILKSDLENHAIYYLKAYNTNIENKVKIDTSVFNIHYITEEEKDNPILTINGKKYSVLPYDNLTDSSTKSEDENYSSGGSCAVGDFNCTSSMMGSNFKWSDIFTSPLDFIKGIWSSVTQVFIVIGYFISLLPVQLQYFLYISFMLAIILGLLKIIL